MAKMTGNDEKPAERSFRGAVRQAFLSLRTGAEETGDSVRAGQPFAF